MSAYLVKRFELALERFNGAYADPYADAEDRGDAKRALNDARNALLSALPQSDAARKILDERKRQIESEGYTPEHDDQHDERELVNAALCYADIYCVLTQEQHDGIWPWEKMAWKPKTVEQDLIRAAALIIAALERRQRDNERRFQKNGHPF